MSSWLKTFGYSLIEIVSYLKFKTVQFYLRFELYLAQKKLQKSGDNESQNACENLRTKLNLYLEKIPKTENLKQLWPESKILMKKMIDAAKIWFGKIKAKCQEWNTKGEGKKNEVLAVDGVPQINSIDNNLNARERISMNDEWFFIDPKNMEGNGPFTKEQIRQKLSSREVSFTDKLRNSENGSELEVSALMSLDGADAILDEGKLNEDKRKKGPFESLVIKMGLAVVICLGLWLLVVFFITESLGSKNVNIPEQYAEYGSLKPEAKVKRLISQHYDWTNKTKLKVVVGEFKSDADEPNRMDGYLTCSKDGWSAKVSIKARLRDDGKAAQWTLNRAQLMEAFDAIFDDDKLSAINAFDKKDLVEMEKICDKKKR